MSDTQTLENNQNEGLEIFEKAGDRIYHKYDGTPVDPPMADIMDVDVIINEKSQIWVMHDKPFPRRLDWVEYDMDDDSLTFVTKGGKVQDLGMKIQPAIRSLMAKSNNLYTMCVQDGKISNFFMVVIAIRKSGILYRKGGK